MVIYKYCANQVLHKHVLFKFAIVDTNLVRMHEEGRRIAMNKKPKKFKS